MALFTLCAVLVLSFASVDEILTVVIILWCLLLFSMSVVVFNILSQNIFIEALLKKVQECSNY